MIKSNFSSGTVFIKKKVIYIKFWIYRIYPIFDIFWYLLIFDKNIKILRNPDANSFQSAKKFSNSPELSSQHTKKYTNNAANKLALSTLRSAWLQLQILPKTSAKSFAAIAAGS